MRSVLLAVTVVLCFGWYANAATLGAPAAIARAALRRQHASRAFEAQRARVVTAPKYPAPRFFTQYLDHFDGANNATWQQAYYVNDTFWAGPDSDAPVFLCVGGEGPPLDGSVVVDSVHCTGVAVEWLQETKALMFAVEHRYYGCHNTSACPVANVSAPGALHYLSSRQALGDLARFHEFATAAYNLTSAALRRRWVTFGGSYPGMLAGWARLKFPHLFHASVASSAPVRAQVDMTGYEDVVASAYTVADNGVGGSEACRTAIATGHASIAAMFATAAGRGRLATLFGQTPAWYEVTANQGAFAGSGVAYFPAQGNDPACTQPSCNIAAICRVMTDASTGDEVARLAAVRKQQMGWFPRAHMHAIDATLPAPASASALAARRPAAPLESADYWGWQTCTEFAFWQTCEKGSGCMYAQGYVTVASMGAFCGQVWGISPAMVARNVDYSNLYYGADKPAGSCVLYPNGEVDPWHANSVLVSPSPGIPVLMVPGASHHAWTHPSLPTDQASVVAARQQIRDTVTSFLAQDCLQASS